MKKIFRNKKSIAALILAVSIIVCGSIYLVSCYHASEDALMLADSDAASVNIEGWNVLIFGPEDADTAVIFYPGGKVQYESYAPLLKELGEKGIMCALVKMPFNLAIFNMDIAMDVKDYLEQNLDCSKYYLGGHSLGGAVSCELAYKDNNAFDGIILLAAYSAKDLSDTDLRILSIFGSEDMVLVKDKYESSLSNMPASFSEIVIDGGCHSYFGDYGMQKGDGEPNISREEQMAVTVDTISDWIKSED